MHLVSSLCSLPRWSHPISWLWNSSWISPGTLDSYIQLHFQSSTGISTRCFKPTASKREFLPVPPSPKNEQLQPPVSPKPSVSLAVFPISGSSSSVHSVSQAKTLGAMTLSFLCSPLIQSMSKSWWLFLYNLSRIWPHLTSSNTTLWSQLLFFSHQFSLGLLEWHFN